MGFTRSMSIAAASALLLAACGSDDAQELAEQAADAVSDEAEDEDAAPEEDDGDDDGDAVEVTTIDDGAVDATVHYGGLEYTIAGYEVVDLDAEASPDGEVDQRVQGLELVFDVSVYNPTSGTAHPSAQATLEWDEGDTGNVVAVGGRPDFREVPSDASSSGEFVIPISPADLELYDAASARLLLGQDGNSRAQVPIGTEPELIDRFPVQQEQVVGQTLDVGGIAVTIDSAEVRWDTTGGSHVEDGVAQFELSYTMVNDSGSQSCSTRGEGAFALIMPNGEGVVDLGVSERCVRGGETETGVMTGFYIDGDYAGEYTLRHERGDDEDEITFTLEEGEGAPAAERETR